MALKGNKLLSILGTLLLEALVLPTGGVMLRNQMLHKII
jgi:hypothetical protein